MSQIRQQLPQGRSYQKRKRQSRLVVVGLFMAMLSAACSVEDLAGPLEPPTTEEQGSQDQNSEEDQASGEENPGGTQGNEGGQNPNSDNPPIPAPFRPEPDLAELPGLLAVVDGSDVLVMNPDGSRSVAVDGPAFASDSTARQPVWSAEGTNLAWSSTRDDEHAIAWIPTEGLGDIEGSTILSPMPGNPTFYMQWSSDSEQILALRNGQAGGLEASIATEGNDAVTIDDRSPFYVAWAPTKPELLVHVGGGELGGELVLFDLVEPVKQDEPPETILTETGPFTAPIWVNDSTVMTLTAEGLASVTLATGESEIIVETAGPVQFLLSSDGTRLAYTRPNDDGVIAGVPQPRPLRVLDLGTGQETIVIEGAVAWEWSPDGSRLAVLAPDAAGNIDAVSYSRDIVQQGFDGFRWYFWDDEIISATPTHRPSGMEINSYLPFFEQFAQSHHRFSVDGQGFAFAGTVEGEAGIWVQLVEGRGEAFRVSDGDTVTWSESEAVSGGGGTSIL